MTRPSRRHRRQPSRPIAGSLVLILMFLSLRICHPFEIRPGAPVSGKWSIRAAARTLPLAQERWAAMMAPLEEPIEGDGLSSDDERRESALRGTTPPSVRGRGIFVTDPPLFGRRPAVVAVASSMTIPFVSSTVLGGVAVSPAGANSPSPGAARRCTDLESCREIGEAKDEMDLRDNPITRLPSGVRYRVLRPGVGGGGAVVREDSTVDMIYSISQASGRYMYSMGFGYERVRSEWADGGGGIGGATTRSDLGSDSLRVDLGKKDGGANRDVPLGIEQALVGMRVGERRRIVLPPEVGFETSGWRPEPTTRMGRAQIVAYRRLLDGLGSNQPPFPAPTLWDVEVVRIRK